MEINDIVILYGNMFGILYDQGQSHGGTLKCFSFATIQIVKSNILVGSCD